MDTDKLTWRDVFDTNHKFHGSIAEVVNVILPTGYRWFCFNGKIYFLTDSGKYIDTTLVIDDVDKGDINKKSIYEAILKAL